MDTKENQHLAKPFIFFSKYSGLTVIAIGPFVLAGWIFDIQIFKSVLQVSRQ